MDLEPEATIVMPLGLSFAPEDRGVLDVDQFTGPVGLRRPPGYRLETSVLDRDVRQVYSYEFVVMTTRIQRRRPTDAEIRFAREVEEPLARLQSDDLSVLTRFHIN